MSKKKQTAKSKIINLRDIEIDYDTEEKEKPTKFVKNITKALMDKAIEVDEIMGKDIDNLKTYLHMMILIY
jgi:hypothetical protein